MTVKGQLGLDDPGRMLRELERVTNVTWRWQEVEHGPALTGGIAEILLEALIAKSAEASLEYVVRVARERVDRWRGERLGPLQTHVDVSPVDETELDGAGG
ncbi:hypothetical protein [Streptomyces mashuensis]|uniref:hypothetical protein n=1 Tax=Streptomyces mashuensis TaxID=33904 RepID=UPI00167CEFCE|nr:hypothetical protein [Streptomyces mashuensis]